MRDLRQKLKLQANAEANQRASYYLLNHVARSDDAVSYTHLDVYKRQWLM